MLKIALMLGLGVAALLPSQAANAGPLGSTSYSLHVTNNPNPSYLDKYNRPPSVSAMRSNAPRVSNPKNTVYTKLPRNR
jgi:hypothetical protein